MGGLYRDGKILRVGGSGALSRVGQNNQSIAI